MSLKIIDYSDFCFRLLLSQPVPPLRGGKFVQLLHGEDEYLIFSPARLSTYHANIVERFCSLEGVAGGYEKENEHYAIYDPEWSVNGGGRWETDETQKTLRLFGSSLAYGRFDALWLAERLSATAEFKDYTILIE